MGHSLGQKTSREIHCDFNLFEKLSEKYLSHSFVSDGNQTSYQF